ncbi:MATE family efflux transporter [Candidatus Enterococcus leclercqii]|uniref:MATE family efflux transporter n=1 Tax=Candidatus Enterococcus leclercqii TaxID=1857218 RepID=UPI00137B05EB|nr:MATE family efflux transporter [Enterococcus sp. CU9D]
MRDELAALRGIRGEQWLFLLKKSGILFLQELLEGSVFQVLLTAALVRLGGLIFAAYQVCRTLTEIFLAPMFMYCSGLLVLIGEKIGKRELDEARQLPKITLQLIIGIYGILAICSWFWQKSLISLVTDIPQVAQTAVSVLGVVILCESTRPFYEVHKYSLQALSGEEVALKITACVNGLVLLLLWLLPNRLEVILLLAAAGNLGAAGAFQLSFKRRLCRIRHGEEK